jgi:threonine efflux protein
MAYWGFLLTITGVLALSLLSPGPNFVIVTSTAMTHSRRSGVLIGLGLAAASFTWALLAVAGLALIISKAGWLYLAIKLTGAVYLIVLGVRMVLGARKPLPVSNAGAVDGFGAVRKGFVVSMTNPKSIAFYASIFAIMVPVHAPVWVYTAIVVISALLSALWYCGLALLFSHGTVRRQFARVKAWMETAMGLVLIGLGSRLLVSR